VAPDKENDMNSNTARRAALAGTLTLALALVGLFANAADAKVVMPDLEKTLPTFEWEIICYEDGDAGWGVMWTSTDEHHSYEVLQGANGMALSASVTIEPASGGPMVVETGVLIPHSHGVLSNAQLKVDDLVVWGPQDIEFDCREDLPASSISVDPELPTPVSIPTTSTTIAGTETVEPEVLSSTDEEIDAPAAEVAAAAPAMLPRTGVSTTVFVVIAVLLAAVGESLLLLAARRKLN
jgi:hypothetical protein